MTRNVPNPGNYEIQIGQQFVNFRNAYQEIVNENEYIASVGGAAFLTAAPFNWSSQDAAAFIAALGNISNLPGVVNAINGSQPFWGGQ